MAITPDDLARATERLRRGPGEWAAWLEVAALLGALGAADEAELAFATIGEGARVSGRVALAVACARHLAEAGSVRGPELVDRIVDTYATGGPHFAFTTPPTPDEPPPELAAPSGAPADQARAVDDARGVIEQLRPWLTRRHPGKLPPAPLLSALPKTGARALIGVMTARALPAGTRILEIGAPATALYWLAHGTVTVARGAAQLGELHSGAFFGEIALVGGTTRTASVTASEDVWLLEIPARAVEAAAAQHPRLAEVLAFHARARLLANLTRTSELFRALADTDREELLGKFETQLVPAGTTFIQEGARNDHLWVVVSGRCEVRAAGAQVAELGPGAAVGEISLVSGAPAVADVVAVEPAVLLRLSRAAFDAVGKRHPELVAAVEKLVIARETQNRALFQDASDLIV